MKLDVTEQIKKLVEQASKAQDGGDAMRYSQAAVNVANAMSVIYNLKP